LSPLDEQTMISILTEPKNAIIKQYQHLFKMENTSLEFTDEALKTIAHEAMKRDVGARALRSVVEELMLELLYELPEAKEEGAVYKITADMIANPIKPNLFTTKQQKKSA